MIETDTTNLKGGDKYGDILSYTVIYSLVNLYNGKRYIGRTRNPKQRLNSHLSALKGRFHANHLINKDSDCLFGFEILEENVPFVDETDRELFYIAEYKTFDERYGYNCNDPAVRTTKTKRFTRRMEEYLKAKREKDAASFYYNRTARTE